MSDKVSIIIRGKNEEDWLSLCLKSINNQTYSNFENKLFKLFKLHVLPITLNKFDIHCKQNNRTF